MSTNQSYPFDFSINPIAICHSMIFTNVSKQEARKTCDCEEKFTQKVSTVLTPMI